MFWFRTRDINSDIKQKQSDSKSPRFLRGFLLILWAVCYIGLLNPYHLRHFEQMQLFRFDTHYLQTYFEFPGSISSLIADFLVQFYIFPWAGTGLVLLLIILYYLLTRFISSRFNVSWNPVLSLSVILFTLLQTYHDYPLHTSIAFLITLGFFALYLIIKNKLLKCLAATIIPGVLFITAGAFAGLFLILVLVREFIISNKKRDKVSILISLASGFVLIYFLYGFLYITPLQTITACLPFLKLNLLYNIYFLFILLSIPLSIILIPRFPQIGHYRNKKPALLLTIPVIVLLTIVSYDYKTEKLFEIEYHFYQEDYEKVVGLVENYPGNNHLAIYMGNIALGKTNRIGDHLFDFRQIYGQTGFTMAGEPVNIAALYGSEVYDHLKYYNEARHWAYESFVSNGQTPHIIKRLVKYELANGNYELAKKYMRLLGQTLFYRKWALEYHKYTESPLLIVSDDELSGMRRFLAHKDFYHDELEMRLKALLTLYPDNRAAFDYMLSYALLKKDLPLFLSGFEHISEFPSRELPIHYEEALLVCETIFPDKKEAISTLNIREETKKRFDRYVHLFQTAKGKEAYKKISKEFGHTLWFYIDFYPEVKGEHNDNSMILY